MSANQPAQSISSAAGVKLISKSLEWSTCKTGYRAEEFKEQKNNDDWTGWIPLSSLAYTFN